MKLILALLLLLVTGAVLALPFSYWLVASWYLAYARRFCRRSGLKLRRYRYGPWREEASGVKTELVLFELDCVDTTGNRRFVRLLIWATGVRRVLANEVVPEATTD
jgi:hypothetical protein